MFDTNVFFLYYRRIYLVRPKINIMKIIADQIATEQARQEKREYRIVMVPRKVRIRVTVVKRNNCCFYFLLFRD